MPESATPEDIKRWFRQAEDYTRQFHDEVRTAYDVMEREVPPVTDSRLVEGVAEYQTPSVKKQVNLGTQFLRLNDTLIDAIEGKEGTTGEGEANNLRLWGAREYNRQNFGYWVDDRLGEGLCVTGLAVMRLLSHPWDDKDIEGDREEWMKYNLSGVHYFDDLDIRGYKWMPDKNGYEVAFYEAEYPVITARDKIKRKGYGDDKKGTYVPGLATSSSGIQWVGESEAVDDATKEWDQKITLTVMEYRDDSQRCPICPDKHPLWSGVELIRADGKELKDAEEVRRYTVGRRHSGTFRMCGQRTSSRAPQYSYMPLMLELIKIAGWINWCITMLGTLANEKSINDRVYLDASKMPEGLQLSGEYYEKLFTNPLPAPKLNSQEAGVQAYPGELKVWPTADLVPEFESLLDRLTVMFNEAKLNPFLTGNNEEAVIRGAATSNLQALQQARVPFNGPRSAMDAFWQQALEDEVHEILYWNHENTSSQEMRFYNQTLGNETIARGETKAGNWVYMAPSKFTTRPSLSTRTKTETLQEQAEQQRMAFERFDRGFEDEVETAKALGVVDTESWSARLWQQAIRNQAGPEQLQEAQMVIRAIRHASGRTHPLGLTLAGLQQQAQQAPQGQPVGGGGPRTPQVQLPALGAPDQGAVPAGAV